MEKKIEKLQEQLECFKYGVIQAVERSSLNINTNEYKPGPQCHRDRVDLRRRIRTVILNKGNNTFFYKLILRCIRNFNCFTFVF